MFGVIERVTFHAYAISLNEKEFEAARLDRACNDSTFLWWYVRNLLE